MPQRPLRRIGRCLRSVFLVRVKYAGAPHAAFFAIDAVDGSSTYSNFREPVERELLEMEGRNR